MNRDHLPALDAARGVAALAVLTLHLKDYIGEFVLLRGSFLAVDLFFLMSGFVIGLSYDERLRNRAISLPDFVWSRVLRLYPLYLLACVIGASYFLSKALMGVDDAPTYLELVGALPSTLMLLPSPTTSAWGFTPYPFTPSAWSLSLELWFNFVYAIVVIRLRSRYLVALALLASAVLIQQAVAFGTLDLGYSFPTLIGGMARFWLSFTIGLLVFRWRSSLQMSAAVPIWVMLPAFAFTAFAPNAIALGFFWIVVVFPAALIVALSYRAGPWAGFVCDHLGRLSYGIYILHAPVILLTLGVLKVVAGDAWNASPWLLAALLFTSVAVVSAFGTYIFDEPVRRRLKHRTRSRAGRKEPELR